MCLVTYVILDMYVNENFRPALQVEICKKDSFLENIINYKTK